MAPRRSPTSLLPRRAQLADRVGDLLPCRASQVTRGRYVATGSSGRELRPNRALRERPSRASSAPVAYCGTPDLIDSSLDAKMAVELRVCVGAVRHRLMLNGL